MAAATVLSAAPAAGPRRRPSLPAAAAASSMVPSSSSPRAPLDARRRCSLQSSSLSSSSSSSLSLRRALHASSPLNAVPAGNTSVRSTADGRWKRDSHPDVVLVADVGGTNARFVLTRVGDGEGEGNTTGEEILQVVYPTSRHATFADALAALEREPAFVAPRAAAFAVAGPVARNRCEMTNLSWTIDGDFLSKKLGVKVSVLNDFEAAGYGVLDLRPGDGDVLPLNDVPADPRGPIAVLGPGTGLGQAQLFWDADEGHYRVWPSEGAHGGFAPRGWRQRALSGSVEDALGYCEVEHVACGVGLERIYAFLSSDSNFCSPSSSSAAASDLSSSTSSKGAELGTVLSPRVAAPTITAAAALGTDPVASEAVDMFLSILGAEAGAMALRSLATGGVYLCGGITAKLAKATRSQSGGNGNGSVASSSSSSSAPLGGLLAPPSPLLDAFLWRRSKFGKLLSTIPFAAVIDDGLGLRGARVFASRSLTRAQAEE